MPRLGTVSWMKEDWEGVFYPEGLARDRWLAHYARTFDTVEVDSTFYRMPSPEICRAWRTATPPDFRFSVKVPGRITHQKVLQDCEREMDRFQTSIGELGEKLGMAVLQFKFFGRKSACPDLDRFLERLDEFAPLISRRIHYAVEVRNADWLRPELFDFLRGHELALALAQVDGMPDPRELWNRYGPELLTGGACYLRLFGERKKMDARTRTFNRLILDRMRETRDWVRVIREIENSGAPAWTYFSNYYAGYAPGSAELFRKLWAAPAPEPSARLRRISSVRRATPGARMIRSRRRSRR